MEEKYISDRILYIYEKFLEILLMQIRSLYEEYDETYLDEFELKYREKYKNLISKLLIETDLGDKLTSFLLIEQDNYGLDRSENDIKFVISDIFRNIGVELSVESMMIKDKWKENQVGKLTSEILDLSEKLQSHKLEVEKLNSDIEKEKYENVNLKLEISHITKKLELSKSNSEKKAKDYESNIKNYKNKLDKSEKQNIKLIKEKEELNTKIKKLEKDIVSIKKETINKQSEDQINSISKLKNEVEHLKNGIDLLRSKSSENEKKLKQTINIKEKLEVENKEIEKVLFEKDKEIKLLQQKVKKLSSIKVDPKMTMDEIEAYYSEVCEALRRQLRKTLSGMDNKVIKGQRTMPIASHIDKLAKNLKTIENITEFKSNLDKLILELDQFNNLFEQNDKTSGLIQYINELNKLKSRI